MKTVLTLFLCLTITSVVSANIQPIGALGKGELKEISFLPDGRILRVLANRIEFVDPDTGATLERFADRTEYMGKITVSRDSSHLVVVKVDHSSAQTVIEIWKLASLRKILQYTIPLALYSTTLNPDLTVLAGYDEGIIRLWNVETGESLDEIEWMERSGFVQLAFSPDGRQLLSISSYIVRDLPGGADFWETAIDTWDTTSHQRILSRKEPFRITGAVYSPNGHWIVMADVNRRIRLWDAKLGMEQQIWRVTGDVQQMQFSSDSQQIYIASGTGGYPRQPNRVGIWDIETGEQLKELGDKTLGLKGFSMSPDERQAVLWYYDGFVALWDIEQRRRLAFRTDYVYPRWGAASPDGRYFVSVVGSALIIWNIRSQLVQKVIFPEERFFRQIAMSPHGQTFAVDQDPWIEIRETRSGRIVSKIPNDDGLTPFVFSNDGRRLALGQGSSVVIYNLHNPEKREELSPKGRDHITERHIAFSTDDRYLAVADFNDEVHLWVRNEDKYAFRYSWKIPGTQIDDIAFEPDRRNPALVVISNLDQLQVWELGTAAPEQSIRFEASAPIQFVRSGSVSSHFPSPRLPEQRDYLFVNHKGRLQIWDWAAKTSLAIPNIPRYFAANQDGSAVITRDNVSYQTRIWNVCSLLFPKPVLLGEVKRTTLLANFPNPLNPETWIPYQLAEPAHVRICIYDVAGHLVRELDLGAKPARSYLSRESAAYWNGRNDMGGEVSSGMYFYTLEAGNYGTTRRMVVVR